MKIISKDIHLPCDSTWQEALRFYCQTSEPDDPTLPFMASMWSYSIANGGLTGKQSVSANRYLEYRMKNLGVNEWEGLEGDQE